MSLRPEKWLLPNPFYGKLNYAFRTLRFVDEWIYTEKISDPNWAFWKLVELKSSISLPSKGYLNRCWLDNDANSVQESGKTYFLVCDKISENEHGLVLLHSGEVSISRRQTLASPDMICFL